MDLRRRNGVPAACDPCRGRKIRCDHGKPACGRCQRRGLAERCVYQRPPATGEADDVPSEERRPRRLTPKTPLTPRPPSCSDTRQQRVERVLQQLKHLHRLDALVRDYIGSEGSIVPGPILIVLLDAVRRLPSLREVSNGSASDSAALVRTAQETIGTSSRAIDITGSTTVAGFCSSLCDDHVRLEVLGLLYSVAARACRAASKKGDSSYDDFIFSLYSSSLECRALARECAAVNDALVWLSYENCILTSHMHGDSSDLVWQRLDYLCGDLLALGVQKDSFNTTNTPPFLTELRRQLFHRTYGLDVYVSTVFDRPPRISKRHSNCPLPLDLSDEQVCTYDVTVGNPHVSEDGWSLSGQTHTATWVRCRSLFSNIKEEIAECSILPPNTETRSQLRNLSLRSNELWNALPTYVRDPFPFTRLRFLQCEMQIHAILMQQDESEWAWEPSLKVAAEVMSHVLTIGEAIQAKDDATMSHADFPDIVVGFGLASAGIIARALQDLASGRAPCQLPPGLSRVTLIRNLLTFISHLENLSGATYHAANVAFSNAARTLSRAVDEVLDPTRSTETNAAAAMPAGAPSGPDDSSSQLAKSASPVLFSTQPLDDLELSTWLNGLDWTGVAENWIDF